MRGSLAGKNYINIYIYIYIYKEERVGGINTMQLNLFGGGAGDWYFVSCKLDT